MATNHPRLREGDRVRFAPGLSRPQAVLRRCCLERGLRRTHRVERCHLLVVPDANWVRTDKAGLDPEQRYALERGIPRMLEIDFVDWIRREDAVQATLPRPQRTPAPRQNALLRTLGRSARGAYRCTI